MTIKFIHRGMKHEISEELVDLYRSKFDLDIVDQVKKALDSYFTNSDEVLLLPNGASYPEVVLLGYDEDTPVLEYREPDDEDN